MEPEFKTAEVFGLPVQIPAFVNLPLRSVSKGLNSKPVLKVEVGTLENPSTVFDLDTAVQLQFNLPYVSVNPLLVLDENALSHYLIDHAIPNALALSGEVVLHSGAVYSEKHNIGIVFTGESGKGKSTICALLAEQGWSVLGDDSVRLVKGHEGLEMISAYPGIRVNPNAVDICSIFRGQRLTKMADHGKKVRVHDPRVYRHKARARLDMLVDLGADSDNILVQPLGKAETCAAIAASFFNPPSDTSKAIDHLEAAIRISTQLIGYRADYKRSKISSEKLIEILESEIKNRSLDPLSQYERSSVK